MHPELRKLAGGTRRSLGRVEEVIEDVRKEPALFDVIFRGMLAEDPVVRMRAADAVEKVTVEHPEYLLPYKNILLADIVEIKQQEVRWHAAQLLPRLQVTEHERRRILEVLLEYLNDPSRIVRVNALQALADIALDYSALEAQVKAILEVHVKDESAAVRSRCRKLLKRFTP